MFQKNYSKEDEKKLKKFMKFVELSKLLHLKIFLKKIFLDAPNLSGGQRQRLAWQDHFIIIQKY